MRVIQIFNHIIHSFDAIYSQPLMNAVRNIEVSRVDTGT
jgi:hypothetical protein